MSKMVLERHAITSAGINIRMPPPRTLTNEQFFLLAQHNRALRLERTAEGDLIILPLTGGITGNRNMELARQLGNWTRIDGKGATFDCSTGFKLPNGAERSPDAAWVRREPLAALTPEQKEKFLPLCPDFVLELRSPSADLADVQAKLAEYIARGAQLGWLSDPQERRVHVYRPTRRRNFWSTSSASQARPCCPASRSN